MTHRGAGSYYTLVTRVLYTYTYRTRAYCSAVLNRQKPLCAGIAALPIHVPSTRIRSRPMQIVGNVLNRRSLTLNRRDLSLDTKSVSFQSTCRNRLAFVVLLRTVVCAIGINNRYERKAIFTGETKRDRSTESQYDKRFIADNSIRGGGLRKLSSSNRIIQPRETRKGIFLKTLSATRNCIKKRLVVLIHMKKLLQLSRNIDSGRTVYYNNTVLYIILYIFSRVFQIFPCGGRPYSRQPLK